MKVRYIFLVLWMVCLSGAAYAQQVAIKSNLLSAVETSLNAGVEYALGMKSTIDLSGSIRPWTRTAGNVERYWMVRPEYRYWVCQKFNGSFWGAYLNGAQFNMGGKKLPFGIFPSLEKRRYSGWMAGVGGSYGYHLLLNRHWNIEFSISVGYEYIDYKKYKCPDVCSKVIGKDVYHYVGPTGAAISAVYVF